jgi:GntR family transcriptional regulator
MDNFADRELPRHARIAADLRRAIGSGTLAVGERLPSEVELVARYDVARGTVRQALAALRTEGLVAGGRGAPPRVRAPRLSQPIAELISFSAWLRSVGRMPSGRVISWEFERADRRTAAALGIAPGATVRRLVRLRMADGEPVMIERTAFPLEICGLVGEVDLERGSIFASLGERGIVFERARQEIDAVAASAADARLLRCRVRAPLLRVRRTSYSPVGRPLESSEDRYLAERVTLTIDHSAADPSLVRRLPATGTD